MAMIEDPLEFKEEPALVVEFRTLPINWMTNGRLQAAFLLQRAHADILVKIMREARLHLPR